MGQQEVEVMRKVVVLLAGLGVVMSMAPVGAQVGVDTILVEKAGEDLSPVEIAVAISQNAPGEESPGIVVARDDAFADAMASGLLQSAARLFLVPTAGPVPQGVREEITRLGPGTATILGGTAAVSDTVEQELAALGLATSRRAGASRFETAIEIARTDAAGATTAMLVRAFGDDGNPTAAFADTLGAGAVAAEQGWPILLTGSTELPTPTAEYLSDSAIEDVLIVGGTAAVAEAVADQVRALGMTVERVAGQTRFETALALAEKGQGATSAADVPHVVLAEATSDDAWAAGFASASSAAALDAPVVLAAAGTLPDSTEAWLMGGAFAGTTARLTCVNVADICEEARLALGLPPDDGTAPVDPGVQLQGDCDGFGTAALSGDASTVAYVAIPDCPDGPDAAGDANLVFVDTSTGDTAVVGLPYDPSCGAEFNTAVSMSQDGAVAAVEGFPDCESSPRDVLIVQQDGRTVQSVRTVCDGGSWPGLTRNAVTADRQLNLSSSDATRCGQGGTFDVPTGDFVVAANFCGTYLQQFTSGICTARFPATTEGPFVAVGGNADVQGSGAGPAQVIVIDPTSGDFTTAETADGLFTTCTAVAVSDDQARAVLQCLAGFDAATVVVEMATGGDQTLDGQFVGTMTPDGRYLVSQADQQIVITDLDSGAQAQGPAGFNPVLSDDGSTLLHATADTLTVGPATLP